MSMLFVLSKMTRFLLGWDWESFWWLSIGWWWKVSFVRLLLWPPPLMDGRENIVERYRRKKARSEGAQAQIMPSWSSMVVQTRRSKPIQLVS